MLSRSFVSRKKSSLVNKAMTAFFCSAAEAQLFSSQKWRWNLFCINLVTGHLTSEVCVIIKFSLAQFILQVIARKVFCRKTILISRLIYFFHSVCFGYSMFMLRNFNCLTKRWLILFTKHNCYYFSIDFILLCLNTQALYVSDGKVSIKFNYYCFIYLKLFSFQCDKCFTKQVANFQCIGLLNVVVYITWSIGVL